MDRNSLKPLSKVGPVAVPIYIKLTITQNIFVDIKQHFISALA
jgi:hypothetical protein